MRGVALVQVVHVTGPESVDEATAAAAHVDALLLDSGNPTLAVKDQVQPWGVDVCSGIRTDGRLDRAKLEPFVLECRRRFERTNAS
jgi:phosphoribosylanthranilate isomerase